MSEIAQASNEQAAGIAQISQGLSQVSQVVQTNSVTSQQGAAASEELSSQAELLKEQVNRFKIREKEEDEGVVEPSYQNELSPEILKMLEDITSKKKAEIDSPEVIAEEPELAKIALSDKEFGKY